MTTDPIAAQEARRAQLAKLTKPRLIIMCRLGITAPDGRKVQIIGGKYSLEQWPKDEIINSILSVEFSQTGN